MGITTPRSAGTAVRRNRIKRLIRERYRTHRDEFPAEGTLLFRVTRCDDEKRLMDELPRLVARAVKLASGTSNQKPVSSNQKPGTPE